MGVIFLLTGEQRTQIGISDPCQECVLFTSSASLCYWLFSHCQWDITSLTTIQRQSHQSKISGESDFEDLWGKRLLRDVLAAESVAVGGQEEEWNCPKFVVNARKRGLRDVAKANIVHMIFTLPNVGACVSPGICRPESPL